MVTEKSLKNLKPAKPGEIRNPHGRPPKSKCLADCLDAELKELSPNGVQTNEQLIASRLVGMAARGTKWAVELLFQYKLSKPIQGLDLTSNGERLQYNIIVATEASKELLRRVLKGEGTSDGSSD